MIAYLVSTCHMLYATHLNQYQNKYYLKILCRPASEWLTVNHIVHFKSSVSVESRMHLRVQTWSPFVLSVFLPVSSGRSQEPDSYGSKWFIRPLCQTQAHPRPKEWDQTEDQDHPFLPQPLLERVLHLVSLMFCLRSLTSEEHFINGVQVYIVWSSIVLFVHT